MARCFLCGKSRQVGRSSRHKRGVAGKQWLKRAQKTVKIFKPNLHVTRLEKNNQKIKAKVCTKCLRRIKKKGETIHGWKAVAAKEPSSVPTSVGASKGKEEKVKDKPFIVKKLPKGRSASGGKSAPKKPPAKKKG